MTQLYAYTLRKMYIDVILVVQCRTYKMLLTVFLISIPTMTNLYAYIYNMQTAKYAILVIKRTTHSGPHAPNINRRHHQFICLYTMQSMNTT